MNHDKPIAQLEPARFLPDIKPGYGLVVPTWGLFMLSVFGLLYVAQNLLIPIALAGVAALILSPLVRALRRVYVPSPLASLLVLVIVFGSLAALANYLSGPVVEWADRIPQNAKALEQKLSQFKEPIRNVKETTETLDAMASVDSEKTQAQEVVIREPGLGTMLYDSTQAFIFGLISFLVLLFFLLGFGQSLTSMLVMVGRKYHTSKALTRAVRRVQSEVSHYLFVISCVNVGLGVVIATTLALLDFPNPVLWGTIVAFLNYFPYVGSFISFSLVGLVSVMTHNSVEMMWQAPLAVLVINSLEGQLLQPLFVGNYFKLNPIIVFISILCWGWLWGVAGIVLAIPSLMMLQILYCELKHA